MSVPALVISMNALNLSQQQQRDLRAQREEENKEKARAKAEAENLRKIAFAERVPVWKPDILAEDWSFRNSNNHPIYLYRRWTPTDTQRSRYYLYVLAPCSQGTIRTPPSKRGASWSWLVTNDQHAQYGYLLRLAPGDVDPDPVDFREWLDGNQILVTAVEHTALGITPCT